MYTLQLRERLNTRKLCIANVNWQDSHSGNEVLTKQAEMQKFFEKDQTTTALSRYYL